MSVHELFVYLRVRNAAKAIDFYSAAFGAKEKFRLTEPGGRVGHAELDFGGATLMLSDEFPEYNLPGPETVGGTTMSIHVHVDDVDDVMRQAAGAGAEIIREAKGQFYGERSGTLRDPFGHEWNVGQSIEDVSPDEMQRRYGQLSSAGG